MRSGGYTLIELLVVISILALMAVLGFISYGNFSKDRAADKALIEVQTILRLAQGNATSSTLCNSQAAVAWKVVIQPGGSDLKLRCDPEDYEHKSYTLQNAKIDGSRGIDCGALDIIIPLTLTYSSGNGNLVFSSSSTASTTCLNSETWIFTINTNKSFNISRGGAINVE